ncbi:MAG TPA: DUF6095 family protein [Salinimicrobium sp.]|nr:DUF6095 family protein [Salinimicrobium sp.]
MKHTDKSKLLKGVKFMAGALPLAFIGPIVIHSSFNNQDHPFYIPILILGILIAISSGFLILRGIRTLMSALFD